MDDMSEHTCTKRFEDSNGIDLWCLDCIRKLKFDIVVQIETGFYHCFTKSSKPYLNLFTTYSAFNQMDPKEFELEQITYCFITCSSRANIPLYCCTTKKYNIRCQHRFIPRRVALDYISF
jgi:hypothetical protein